MAVTKKKASQRGVMTLEQVLERRPVDPVRAKKIRAESEAYVALFPLIDLREDFGLTQSALANDIGIDQSNVSRIERGKISTMEIATLQKYIEALGGTIEIHARFGKKTHLITDSELLDAESNF